MLGVDNGMHFDLQMTVIGLRLLTYNINSPLVIIRLSKYH